MHHTLSKLPHTCCGPVFMWLCRDVHYVYERYSVAVLYCCRVDLVFIEVNELTNWDEMVMLCVVCTVNSRWMRWAWCSYNTRTTVVRSVSTAVAVSAAKWSLRARSVVTSGRCDVAPTHLSSIDTLRRSLSLWSSPAACPSSVYSRTYQYQRSSSCTHLAMWNCHDRLHNQFKC